MSIAFKKGKSIEFYLAYHQAIIRYHTICLSALNIGVDIDDIYKYSLPINIASPQLIDSYTRCIQKEIEKLNEQKESQQAIQAAVQS